MQRIIYISSARAPLESAELDGILRTSRRNNAAAGVTGMLVVGGKRFLQTLEGPEAAVEQTFERIKRDIRHYAVVTLSRKTIDQPSFGDWSMGYRTGGPNMGAGKSLEEVVAGLLKPVDDPMVRAYFTGFAEIHAAA